LTSPENGRNLFQIFPEFLYLTANKAERAGLLRFAGLVSSVQPESTLRPGFR
jgi:hypothetical protein